MADLQAAVVHDQQVSSGSAQNTTADQHTKSDEPQSPAASEMDLKKEDLQQATISATDQPQIVQSCALMKLSGELRNTIYRYVLLEEESIEVTATGYSTNGGVLLACKAIRAEAYEIFYLENNFIFMAINFDSQLPVKFWDVVPDGTTFDIGHKQPRRPCWSNLMVWLEKLHAGDCGSGFGTPEESKKQGLNELDTLILSAMFATVQHLDDQPWAKVKPLVEMHRTVLSEIDPRWGGDDG